MHKVSPPAPPAMHCGNAAVALKFHAHGGKKSYQSVPAIQTVIHVGRGCPAFANVEKMTHRDIVPHLDLTLDGRGNEADPPELNLRHHRQARMN